MAKEPGGSPSVFYCTFSVAISLFRPISADYNDGFSVLSLPYSFSLVYGLCYKVLNCKIPFIVYSDNII